ncbi:MAG: nucleoside-diphosphate sugar epimerase [Clostridiales bacterium]|nr:MAG: nucleoside-diphosphate sugar epimerase [Clostridiales bacterium]
MGKTLYLLTGATGFLGSNICAQLLERGEKVRAFVLNGDKTVKYLPEEVEVFYGDLCAPEDCQRFFDVEAGIETVCIHCASMVTVNPEYNEKLVKVNVGGTENMLAAAKAHKECQKFVYVSSTSAIPEVPKGQRIKEVKEYYPCDESKVVGWYSLTKAMATQKVMDAAKDGLNACVVMPSGILGPNDHAIGETTGTIIKIIKGEMPIGMAGSFNLCDVRDLAYGCIAAADKGHKGEAYILANEEVTLKELCTLLDKDLHCGTCKFYLPLGLAKKLAKLMEKKAAKKGTKPLMTTFSVYNLERNNSFDYSKAKKELGYKVRSYVDTLHDEALWLKKEGRI